MIDLLLADARTPTGGFVHSGGVEAARIDLVALPSFLRGRLATVGLLDAAVVSAVARGERPLKLEAAWVARTPSAPLREAARRQGRALLRVAEALWPGALDDYAAVARHTPRAVVLGLCCAAAGLSPVRAAEICLYDDAATCCSAVPKLQPVDALEATAVLAGLRELIASLAVRASRPGPLPVASAPLLDLRSVRHVHDLRRLFAT